MDAQDLAEELAEFWLPALAGKSWEERTSILDQILEKLTADAPDAKLYRRVMPLFLATVIDRLGTDQPVVNKYQALIYAQSASPRHRARAQESFPDVHPEPAWRAHPRHNPADQRRAPRHRVSATGTLELEAGGEAATCRVEDLSRTGARISVSKSLTQGQSVRLTLTPRTPSPHPRARRAQVVRVSGESCGIAFKEAA